MRVAAIYDIHANLPALEAVLKEVSAVGVDQLVVGGDVVAGPMPDETLARLLDFPLPVAFVRGNADREVLDHISGMDPGALPDHIRETVTWAAARLAPERVRAMTAWQKDLRLEMEGLGRVLFCHATPRNDTDVFTRQTPGERLLPIFASLDVDLVVCGHTHMQFDRHVGRVRVVNAGSVGMPYGEPGAHWLLLGPDVQFMRTPYNRQEAARRILATDYPQAREFAAENVLECPSEAEALEVFTRMEIGKI